MKASDLVKKEMTIKDLYESIQMSNEQGSFKYFIPHYMYVSENTKLKLIEDGFKVCSGSWIGGDEGLIIEW